MRKAFVSTTVAGLSIALVAVGSSSALAAPTPVRSQVDAGTAQLLVKYREGATAAAQVRAERGAGAVKRGAVDKLDVRVLEVPRGAETRVMTALSRSGLVEYVEVDGVFKGETTPDDPMWAQQWGPSQVRMPEAWDRSQGDVGTVVAVLDTGIDASHPELAGRVVPGRDFINGDDDAADDHGHGTKSAGVVAARTGNGAGLAGACGNCSILPVKVLNASNSGTWAALASGIVWATDQGARVISMSLSGSTSSATVQEAVTYASSRGVLLVAAAGNQGSTSARYPAAYPEVLSVGGTTADDTRYSWSNYGDTVDVYAPGCNTTTERGGTYATAFCGTSSAAPLVAGAAALAFSLTPDATAEAVSSALRSSALVLPSPIIGGRLDVAAAFELLAPMAVEAPVIVDEPAGSDPVVEEPQPVIEPLPAERPVATQDPVAELPVEIVDEVSATTDKEPVTETITATVGGKVKSLEHPVTVADGGLTVELSHARLSAATVLTVLDATGAPVVVQAGSGQVSVTVPAGRYRVVVTTRGKIDVVLQLSYARPVV
jgi:subtilisin family serine protease